MNSDLTFVVISSTNDLLIEKTLASIDGVGEVLLVDGGPRKMHRSESLEIDLKGLSEKYNCRYLLRKYRYAADQYNFALSKVNSTWAFIIDSDEVLSAELRKFLQMGKFSGKNFYSVKRNNLVLGQIMKYGQFKPDWNIRLIKPSYCKYEDRKVHARMLTQGIGGKASGVLVHSTVESIDSFFMKMIEFSKLETDSRKLRNSSRELKGILRARATKLPFQSSLRFIYSYIVRGGILDGRRGYLFSKSAAFYEIMVEMFRLEQRE